MSDRTLVELTGYTGGAIMIDPEIVQVVRATIENCVVVEYGYSLRDGATTMMLTVRGTPEEVCKTLGIQWRSAQ